MSLSPTRFGADVPTLPAVLPPLTAALSRRAALFGAVTVAGVSVAACSPAKGHAAVLSANDLRLAALADALTALQAEIDGYRGDKDDDAFGLLVGRFDPLMSEMDGTSADTLDGVLHKIRAIELSGVGDDGQAHDIMCSICDDVVRLHGAGMIVRSARLGAGRLA